MPLEDERTVERAAEALEGCVEERSDRCEGSKVTVLRGDGPGVRVTVPDRPEHGQAGRLSGIDVHLSLALTGV